MNQFYQAIGISKQAVYQYARRQHLFDSRVLVLLIEVDQLREVHPGCGVEKMYETLKPDFIGRDRFVDLLMGFGYRLKRVRNYHRTTFSNPVNYPNLIKGLKIHEPCKVWQSDITYIRIGERFYYVVFIIDVYTKKIVGYQVSDHMRATANVKALQMALKKHQAPEIHHSDRGSQYVYEEYILLLKANSCRISMAQTAQDNAYAERINQTIKNEYIAYWKPESFEKLKAYIKRAVNHYNTYRNHNGIGKISPVDFERKWNTLKRKERPLVTIFDKVNNP
jgi:transposase InsO family protein